MSQDKIAQVGFSRDATGRGWTDLLDNQIAIMRALVCISELRLDKHYDIQQALNYRISQTTAFLHGASSASQSAG